ncbi:MAG: tRNA (N(6)-L-threonylcarbamoyladenosine(37)-C(2))-methylthiotransferase MtaB [Elusimicrobia bacterium]|nr:tRNA (N(6)-L-threonylcarbamoyladenosine(37)-C(2))-methylthiotransferase MtaB [Elusimicrobiota bacterium]
MDKMKIHFKTFGCKVNQCETAIMQSKVLEIGCNLSGPEHSDIIVINSCTVTANADRKTKQYLRKCLRLNLESKFFLTGCYADRSWKKLKSEFPNIKLFKNSEKENIQKILGLPLLSTLYPLPSTFSARTRAYIKIQDGCNGKCSYCVVPKVRPKLWSKNIDDVIKDVKNYVSAGHKEIVLCGIRLGRYKVKGERLKVKNLVDLIKELEKIDGLYRIRLSSIELHDITDDLIELMSKSKKLCHHLHISLQSGDDSILSDMKRPYTAGKFFNKIAKIRKKIPDIGITTDIIIGYPNDTEKTLENSYNFVKKCAFSRLHIFRFSRRPGTKADLIKRNCPEAVIKKWQEKFAQLDTHLKKSFLKKFSGKKLEILTESNGCGYTSNYIYLKLPVMHPENEIVCYKKHGTEAEQDTEQTQNSSESVPCKVQCQFSGIYEK